MFAVESIFIDFSSNSHTHKDTRRHTTPPLSRTWSSRRNITSEECDRGWPFCPLAVRWCYWCLKRREWWHKQRKKDESDRLRHWGQGRKSRARFNAGRCCLVWPFWELPLCMTQSVCAGRWDSLGHLRSSWCTATFLLTQRWPIFPIIPQFSLTSSLYFSGNLNSTGFLCVCDTA